MFFGSEFFGVGAYIVTNSFQFVATGNLELNAEQAQHLSYPARIALPAVLAARLNQGSAPSDLDPAQNALIGNIHASTVVDLFTGYDWGNYSVELFGTNIAS